jgi:hypothetical protein
LKLPLISKLPLASITLAPVRVYAFAVIRPATVVEAFGIVNAFPVNELPFPLFGVIL